jgi:hypothetical protein
MTAAQLIQMYKPMYSIIGSNRRENEVALMDRLKEFVFKIEGN